MPAHANFAGEHLLNQRAQLVAALSERCLRIYESLNFYGSWDFSSASPEKRQIAFETLSLFLDKMSLAEVRDLRAATKAHLDCVTFSAISATTCAVNHENSALHGPVDALEAIDKYLEVRA